jgi:tRNA(fMet)-specific endonuclease VapC
LSFLLDTNICIYVLQQRPPRVAERFRQLRPKDIAISVVTILELRHAAERSQAARRAHLRLDDFLGPLQALPFSTEDAIVGARIRAHLDRRGTPIGDFDSLIAAQAIARGLTLVSNNLREFDRVPGLKTANWI